MHFDPNKAIAAKKESRHRRAVEDAISYALARAFTEDPNRYCIDPTRHKRQSKPGQLIQSLSRERREILQTLTAKDWNKGPYQDCLPSKKEDFRRLTNQDKDPVWKWY